MMKRSAAKTPGRERRACVCVCVEEKMERREI
jgi:hypothetical protein